MKKLVRQAGYFLAAGVIGAAAFIATIFLQPPNWKLTAAVALVITVVTIFLFGKVKKDISTARRIIENQILHIQPAVFQDLGEENATDLISGESSRCSFPASVFFLTPKSLSSIRRVSG